MVIGDPALFAIESHIEQVFPERSSMALGYFNIHLLNFRYGVHDRQATLLACSYDEVGRRIELRGLHAAPFATEADSSALASAFRDACYSVKEGRSDYLGLSRDEFVRVVDGNHLLWAPDGDEAFDDSSYVLQFDVDNKVRLVGMRCRTGHSFEPDTLRDVIVPGDEYYGLLAQWRSEFEREWHDRL